ncbi:Protein AGENET DOMAIN (AGD)-CONTAINING P1 [Camellia lanceoleosa]|uniref:Protein AGENET DOMAIN (AGD)-CONTAINING P1 n=1 Tax=Camellia lanceoleosa TaxID=1840588 RepID=A0ACC0G7X1_9ERIC|nr:Protein AGENET DOMAIN (AGD)-CONTAINING P1 [Camellia lanceoleosa]
MAFVRWEEVNVSNDKGRREVHYYLKRRDGTSDLVVIGKEKSLRHMSYHYAIRDRSLLSILPSSSLFKLRSRREVIDWLNSIVPDSPPHQSSEAICGSLDSKDHCKLNVETLKDVQSKKLGHHTAEFVWLGSPWTCRKRRSHYQSFCGMVNEFRYVLAEEDKRLVAYLDDLYEDSRGNKMVVNDDKGYWRQEILRYMYTIPPSKEPVKSLPSEFDLNVERNLGGVGIRPKKRLRRSKDGDLYSHPANKQESLSQCLEVDFADSLVGSKGGPNMCTPKDDYLAACRSVKQSVVQKPPQHLIVGSQVEVLSQDSGLRGCWFRALIIKKHKDKVKVQYQDIKDAVDEAKNLQEWLVASKVAVSDPLGLWTCGRTTIRPSPPSNKGKVPVIVNSGTVVDVWWHDGWWEGIVLQKETEDKIHVYFPGEKQEAIFGCSDLRHSQEWLENGWEHIKERPDIVSSTLSDREMKQITVNKTPDVEPEKTGMCDMRQLVSSVKDEARGSKSRMDYVAVDKVKELKVVRDLSKDALLAQLKWKSSGKRRRGDKTRSSPEGVGMRSFDSFFIPKSLKVDHDNCKFMGDSPFSSSVVPITSLVMSR